VKGVTLCKNKRVVWEGEGVQKTMPFGLEYVNQQDGKARGETAEKHGNLVTETTEKKIEENRLFLNMENSGSGTTKESKKENR